MTWCACSTPCTTWATRSAPRGAAGGHWLRTAHCCWSSRTPVTRSRTTSIRSDGPITACPPSSARQGRSRRTSGWGWARRPVNAGSPPCCARRDSRTYAGRPRPLSTSFWRPDHSHRAHLGQRGLTPGSMLPAHEDKRPGPLITTAALPQCGGRGGQPVAVAAGQGRRAVDDGGGDRVARRHQARAPNTVGGVVMSAEHRGLGPQRAVPRTPHAAVPLGEPLRRRGPHPRRLLGQPPVQQQQRVEELAEVVLCLCAFWRLVGVVFVLLG